MLTKIKIWLIMKRNGFNYESVKCVFSGTTVITMSNDLYLNGE